jgi:hypothetical protein
MEDQFYKPGWEDRPEEVVAIADLQPMPIFSDTPAGQADIVLPKTCYFWKVHEQVTGQKPTPYNQLKVGSCVGFGAVSAIEGTMVNEIMRGEKEEFRPLCQEVSYAGSRIEIGKGRLGRGDGSIGAWAAEFALKYGSIDRGVHGKYDLRKYSEELCREWGNSGVPDDLEPTVKKYPVKGITLVKTWEDAKKALAQGYGISVASNQGFTMSRDAKGMAQPKGRWMHQMCLWGYSTEGSEKGWIRNSWGANAHTGPVGEGDPPTSGFWADAEVISKMLSQGDSWAFSGLSGFPAKDVINVDWNL